MSKSLHYTLVLAWLRSWQKSDGGNALVVGRSGFTTSFARNNVSMIIVFDREFLKSQCDVAMTLQIRGVEHCHHLVLPEAPPEDRSRKVCNHEEGLLVQWQQSVIVHHEVHQIASVASRFYSVHRTFHRYSTRSILLT